MTKIHHLSPNPEAHQTGNTYEVKWDLQKYWYQRHKIWQFYDYDIRMTDDAWFGVTPEPIATQIATDLAAKKSPQTTTIIDLFAGAGGNAIAFAQSGEWQHVIAIEKDAETLACAQHNAEMYEVGEYITWIHGDCFDFLARLKRATVFAELNLGDAGGDAGSPPGLDDSILAVCGILNSGIGRSKPLRTLTETVELFASPPWGGVGYSDHDVFNVVDMQPYGLTQIHEACKPLAHALYLPRTSDLKQLAKLAPAAEKMDVCQYCMYGASKALVAYIPVGA